MSRLPALIPTNLFTAFEQLRTDVAEATKDAAVVYLRHIGEGAYQLRMVKNIADKNFTLVTGMEKWLTEHPTSLHIYLEDRQGNICFWAGERSYEQFKMQPNNIFNKEQISIHFKGLLLPPRMVNFYVKWFQQQYPNGLSDIQKEMSQCQMPS